MDEEQSGAQHGADLSMLPADHMRLRDELRAQQLGHRRRVDGIGLHLRVTDRLQILRVRETEVDALGHEQIAQPVPHARTLADGLMRSVECGKVGGDRRSIRRQIGLANRGASRVHGGNGQRLLVKIDTGVHHLRHSRVKVVRRVSRRRASLGISMGCS